MLQEGTIKRVERERERERTEAHECERGRRWTYFQITIPLFILIDNLTFVFLTGVHH